ncbi:MAG: AarF/UbiB family protein [Chloroflexota bacterium]
MTWFFASLIFHLIWWDWICKLPLLRSIRPESVKRWQSIARRYRRLAHCEGGLLIKVGQFLSLRVDLLPQAVRDELSLLQDRVPAAPWGTIRQHIEADLGVPVTQLFAWVSPQAVASASVAQVHSAQLHSGERVVIKVVRPQVPEQFAMDLKFFALQVRLLSLIPMLRRSFNLPQLLTEFTNVSLRELELVEEGQNAQRFANDFTDEPHIYIPCIYWQYSGAYTLTMEDVGYLSLKDLAAIEAAGIDRKQIAQQLAEIIVKQIFVYHFVHADPHPGNIFIKPLPLLRENRVDFSPGEAVPHVPNRPFQIAFIDFGMAIAIPPEAQAWLREFIIGLGLSDARRIIQAYERGGLLHPEADVVQVEAMTEELLDGFQEMLVGIMPDPNDEKTKRFFERHGDLMGNKYPFKIPMDLLFMYRALNTVGLVVKQVDSDFELSTAVAPLAIRLVLQEWQAAVQERVQTFTTLAQLLITYPMKVDQVLLEARRAFQVPEPVQQLLNLPLRQQTTRTEMDSKDRQTLQQLEGSIRRLHRSMVAFGIIVASLLWFVGLQWVDLLAFFESAADRFGIVAVALSLTFFLWNSIRGGP